MKVRGQIFDLFRTGEEEKVKQGLAIAKSNGIDLDIGTFYSLRDELRIESRTAELDVSIIKGLFNGEDITCYLEYFPQVLLELNRLQKRMVMDISKDDEINPEIFSFTELEVLELEIKNASGLPQEIGNLKKLRDLTLSFVGFQKFPDSFADLDGLEKLTLYATNLNEIPPQVFNLKNLKELHLVGNEQLERIPNEIRSLSNLEKLVIDKSPIQVIPYEIKELVRLKSLTLSYTLINNIHFYFSELTNLEEFELKGNKRLFDLPNYIGRLKKLKSLVVSFSEIKALPTTIGNLSELENFEGINTKFTNLPDSFFTLKNLKFLNFSGASISESFARFSNFPHIERLLLFGTPISKKFRMNEGNEVLKLEVQQFIDANPRCLPVI